MKKQENFNCMWRYSDNILFLCLRLPRFNFRNTANIAEYLCHDEVVPILAVAMLAITQGTHSCVCSINVCILFVVQVRPWAAPGVSQGANIGLGHSNALGWVVSLKWFQDTFGTYRERASEAPLLEFKFLDFLGARISCRSSGVRVSVERR